MSRGLDHIVHAVHDLEAAGAFYRRLGFTVGARNRHPWGTHNYVVQFPGFFIELLTVAEPEKIVASAPRSFSFGAFTQHFLARQEGFAMLLMESADARKDAQAFKFSGVGDYDVFDFAREGSKPDGSAVKVAFSLAFATAPDADAGFFVCQQHHPENFWNPAFQDHANFVSGVAGVMLVAQSPHDYCGFLTAFAGVDALQDEAGGISAVTTRGMIQVMPPARFRDVTGIEPPKTDAGARIAALRLRARNIGALPALLADAGVAAKRCAGGLIIDARDAMGATIIFGPG